MGKWETADLHLRRRKRVINQSQTGAITALTVTGILIAILFLLGNEPASGDPGDTITNSLGSGSAALPGQAIFSAACAPCHGETGAGNPGAGIPALNRDGQVWTQSVEEIETTILVGTPKMPGNAELLDRADVAALVEYLQTLWTQEQRAAFQKDG